jgi:hypothetical protein
MACSTCGKSKVKTSSKTVQYSTQKTTEESPKYVTVNGKLHKIV